MWNNTREKKSRAEDERSFANSNSKNSCVALMILSPSSVSERQRENKSRKKSLTSFSDKVSLQIYFYQSDVFHKICHTVKGVLLAFLPTPFSQEMWKGVFQGRVQYENGISLTALSSKPAVSIPGIEQGRRAIFPTTTRTSTLLSVMLFLLGCSGSLGVEDA